MDLQLQGHARCTIWSIAMGLIGPFLMRREKNIQTGELSVYQLSRQTLWATSLGTIWSPRPWCLNHAGGSYCSMSVLGGEAR